MGTDIHLICEVKENGNWRPNEDKIFPNPDYHWLKEKIEEDPDYKVPKFWEDDLENEFKSNPEDGRWYDKFSILANVRNGYGFAGVKTGSGFNYMSDYRGFPDDTDPNFVEQNREWTHSHTWVGLEDFKNFDWDARTFKDGVIKLSEYKKLRNPLVKHNTETPESWSGGVGGGNTITITSEEADEVLKGTKQFLTREPNEWADETEGTTKHVDEWDVYVEYSWAIKYSEWFDNFIKNWVKPIEELGEKYEDVRVVMSFDS
jgi:hypothetical protein